MAATETVSERSLAVIELRQAASELRKLANQHGWPQHEGLRHAAMVLEARAAALATVWEHPL